MRLRELLGLGDAPQPPVRHDPLADLLDHLAALRGEAQGAVDDSRARRGAPPLAWEDLLDSPPPREQEPS